MKANTVVESLEQLRAILETAKDSLDNLDTASLPTRGIHGKYSDYVSDLLVDQIESITDIIDELVEGQGVR